MDTTPMPTPQDLLTPAVVANPYPAYQQLRDQSPVHYANLQASEAAGSTRGWGFLKYESVYGALRDHDTFSSETDVISFVISSYTIPLPVKVIARLLGIPGEDYETFKRWSDAFISATARAATARMQHVQDILRYFGQMAAAVRQNTSYLMFGFEQLPLRFGSR